MMKRLFAIPGYKLEVEAKGRKLTVIEKDPLKRIIKNAALKRLIERIPENVELPYPIYMLDKTEN